MKTYWVEKTDFHQHDDTQANYSPSCVEVVLASEAREEVSKKREKAWKEEYESAFQILDRSKYVPWEKVKIKLDKQVAENEQRIRAEERKKVASKLRGWISGCHTGITIRTILDDLEHEVIPQPAPLEKLDARDRFEFTAGEVANAVNALVDRWDYFYELISSVQASEKRIKELDLALQSLTPGGSEFVNDPARCVQFVKDVRHADLEAIKRFKKRADEAEASRDALRDFAISYADHKRYCLQEITHGAQSCSCGFNDARETALAAAKKEKEV